jgi:hypothetical protein
MTLSRNAYRLLSFMMAAVFAAVGLIFFLTPGGVIGFFNTLSPRFGMKADPDFGNHFYVVISAAYMYLVTFFALQMARHPESKTYPSLLLQAKCASSLLSFGMFFSRSPYLIILANGIVDGAIAILVWLLFLKPVRTE